MEIDNRMIKLFWSYKNRKFKEIKMCMCVYILEN